MKSWFSNKNKEIGAMIQRLAETGKPLLVHNLAFELGVFAKLYPTLQFNWAADTMRLAQLEDNTGGLHWSEKIETVDDIMDRLLDDVETPTRSGLGLEACASRYLPKIAQNHKSVAHTWLEENHGIKKKHGSHLHLLPYEQLKQYNIADTETTLLLYEELIGRLQAVKYDPAQDWVLYKTRVTLMAGAYLRGITIDRESLKAAILKTDEEVRGILKEFMDATTELRTAWARDNPGKIKRRPIQAEEFNIGSNTQLKQLFVGIMGLSTGKVTATGQKRVDLKAGDEQRLTLTAAALQYPSFASKHLALWGPLGEILYKRRRRLLVLQQMLSVYMGSEEDGRIHPEVRAAGTMTNRVAGGQGIV